MVKRVLVGRRDFRKKQKAISNFNVEVARILDESESTLSMQLNTGQSNKTAMGLIRIALNYRPGTELELWSEFHNGPLPMGPNDFIRDYVRNGDLLMVIPVESV